VDSGLIDVLMFSVNPCYDLQPAGEDVEQLWAESAYEKPLVNMDPQRQALYENCQRRGVGITVMKAFGGGDLLSPHSPAGVALTPFQCLHYALTRPGVACVMAGPDTGGTGPLHRLRGRPRQPAGLRRCLCRHAQNQLERLLYVLRTLRPLPPGD
jgi:hypothetical protein